jgi:1,4-dihydroxy-2-naphthoate polyprenyltransferase
MPARASGPLKRPWPTEIATRHGRLAIWLQTLRLKSLAISSIGVATGAAVALDEGFLSWRTLVAWVGAVAIQAGTNLINVAHNYKTADLGSAMDPLGSSAPVRTGQLDPDHVRRGAWLAFAIGSVAGLTLVALCGWPILLVGVPAVLAGYSYGAPPLRLAYRGLGVVTVFVFMGPVMVIGSYFVAALRLSTVALAVSIPVGLLAAAIMHTNDLRDFDSDVANGKRTLATRLGRRPAILALAAMVAVAYVTIVLAALLHVVPLLTTIVLMTLPAAVRLARAAWTSPDSANLNAAWFMGVRLHTQFGVLLVLALVLARFLPG